MTTVHICTNRECRLSFECPGGPCPFDEPHMCQRCIQQELHAIEAAAADPSTQAALDQLWNIGIGFGPRTGVSRG
jgi:hypothetical protein